MSTQSDSTQSHTDVRKSRPVASDKWRKTHPMHVPAKVCDKASGYHHDGQTEQRTSEYTQAETRNSARTRQQRKQEKKQAKHRQHKRGKRRMLPIWLRLIIVLFLCFVALIAGLSIGYGVIGGDPVKEVFNWDTWQHIIDIVNKKK